MGPAAEGFRLRGTARRCLWRVDPAGVVRVGTVNLDVDGLAGGTSPGYTNGMKTAISVPDQLFEEADRLAKRLRKSRSKLYSLALAEFIARHAPDEVTEAMNRVLEKMSADERLPDAGLQRAARRVLRKVEW